ncbi:TPA: prolyl oligopeptidase family serine peptidase [Elizabethkingia anophelis]|uniref:prolyl oligopeptidase family serine peptidase n=2 Tax=Elizabethkingia anophelis TaxID=1117645 RepID=UPI000665FB27|nr:prolyl oligopeptidase family serine peptidase [Elizabethkingia anophelis]AQW90782.1 prolyl oligopeptidase [Elizabethkingia anophelis]KUY16851.1 prolyl oligopeptidase [Elizabethkingia anophelis]MCT3675357.1 prolyl oligopeptidase family serine peptidase [Elizabethkingia anophelis]MCT3682795.1 prolyl oligopeptidase family serine peptidase [Elizabethkingia anophelis]MCT3701572.1 prolyl oligopeptidase family serine peptidase [Elizabethkingia anophelis]
MQNKIFIITIFFTLFVNAQSNNLALSTAVTDEYHGIKVLDQYRNLENLKDPVTISWMKSQTDYANSVLSSISNRNYYLNKRLDFDKRAGYSVSDLRLTSNDKYFYLKRNVGEKSAKVYYRKGYNGSEIMLYDPSDFISSKKTTDASKRNFVINTISPSWDGSKVAISLTQGGRELSEVIVIDVDNKHVYPETIINTNPANIGGIKWLDDNSGFFYIYYPVVDLQSKDFRKKTQSILYKIGESPTKLKDVFSSVNNPNLKISDTDYPAVLAFNPEDEYYIGILVDAEDFRRTFFIPKKDLLAGSKSWQQLYDKDSKVFSIKLVDNDIYFLSGYNSPNFKLCKTNMTTREFKTPEVLVSEKKDEVIGQYAITKDGIYYVTTKNGVEAKLYLLKNGKETQIKLPFASGNINLQSKGLNFSDIWISCSGWANEEQRFKYDLLANTFESENFGQIIAYPEFKDIVVEEITIKSYDGTEVPLSLIYNKNIERNGNNPLLIDCYGAFGSVSSPFFAKSYLLWVNQGGVMAISHVRGGGEKGEYWHKDGQKLKKPNTWKDLIASTEYLIRKKYSSPERIAIWGSSAGGIAIGRAITERPELFKVAIIESGVLNTTRFDNNGIQETSKKEYGNPNDPVEFKGLLEMDSFQHIKKGKKYPATIVYAGINDPRVAPWQSGKFVAKLLANTTSKNPVLLNIDYDGGHGGDIPVMQRYMNLSNIFSFALWQLGHPDYQQAKAKNK